MLKAKNKTVFDLIVNNKHAIKVYKGIQLVWQKLIKLVDNQEAYTKDILSGTMPYGLFDKIGGKTMVFEQKSNFNNVVGWAYQANELRDILNSTPDGDKLLFRMRCELTSVTRPEETGQFGFLASNTDASKNFNTLQHFWPSLAIGTKVEFVFEYQKPQGSGSNYTRFNVYGCGNNSVGKVGEAHVTIEIYNLTTLGFDNRETFEKVYYKEYYPQTPPTLTSADVVSVESRGKNLLKEFIDNIAISISTGKETISTTSCATDFIEFDNTKNYYISGLTTTLNNFIYFYDENKNGLGRTNGTAIAYRTITPSTSYVQNAKYLRITCYLAGTQTYNFENVLKANPQMEVGTTPTSYVPYFTESKPISSIIAKYFPNGMKSAGSVYDEMDLERGKAIQRVKKIKFGEASSIGGTTTGTNWRIVITIPDLKLAQSSNPKDGVLSADYITDSVSDIYIHKSDKTIAVHYSIHEMWLYDVSLEGKTNDEVKEIIKDKDLCYAIDTPIETDVDAEDLEALRTLHVEELGTLTFKQEGLHIPVPNKETYLVKVV